MVHSYATIWLNMANPIASHIVLQPFVAPVLLYNAIQDIFNGTCPLELPCAQCWPNCDSVEENALIAFGNTIPVCGKLPTGVRAEVAGTTVETFKLERGYYRTSARSSKVLECYRESSCEGGSNAAGYCASGYEGPCK